MTPPHYRLDLDWNSMLLNVGNATPVLQKLDTYERVAIYEGPIPQSDVEGLRELRRKVAHPIALHFGEPPFPTATHEAICDGFVVGGGISKVLRNGALAAEFAKPFWLQLVGVGLVTALSAHLGAVLPFAQWPTITCLNNYSDSLLTHPLTIHDGFLKVPEGPGLGVTVDEDALEGYRMDHLTSCPIHVTFSRFDGRVGASSTLPTSGTMPGPTSWPATIRLRSRVWRLRSGTTTVHRSGRICMNGRCEGRCVARSLASSPCMA